jgi:hypothetical protein
VLLTALTTVLGLVPLTFGINVDFVGLLANFEPNFEIGSENTQFWGPMGTAIISGLVFATFLTLVIVPVLYSAFDSLSLRVTQAFGGDTDDAAIVSETVMTNGEGGATAPDQTDFARRNPSDTGDGAADGTADQPAPARREDPSAP